VKFDFGIDFGTTNSACAGIIDGKKMIKFADRYDGSPFPSLVIIDPVTGEVYCGREAWLKRQEYAEHCEVITSVKTHLGTGKTWRIAGKVWTPEMVAAKVFEGLKKQVASFGKVKMEQAVVAVPVGFSSAKRAELRRAAKRAGVEITTFISEPTAAFFRHYDEIGHYDKVGVLDWGGGTLDITIIEKNSKDTIKELATGGLYVGGDNIDLKLALWAHNEVINKSSTSVSFEEMPPAARDMMIARCERAKRDLADREVVQIVLNKYGELGPIRVTLDIDTFSRLVESEVEQVIECFEATLRRARLSMDELGCILMVGGSVNLRPFIERVEEKWKKCFYPEESDWSVAAGAAMLSVKPGRYKLAETIGVIMSDDSFYPLVHEGDVVDHKTVEHSFALVEDSKTANFIFSDANRRILGRLNVPSFGFFREKIDLQSRIDRDLVLRVTARSAQRSERYTEEWRYPGPRLHYQLPAGFEVAGDE
jgi:molecular chaperone DnaK